MMIHPKTSGAALGGSLGLVIVSVLASVHGVHLTAEANAAIPTFLGTAGAFFVPGPDTPDSRLSLTGRPTTITETAPEPPVVAAPVEPPPVAPTA